MVNNSCLRVRCDGQIQIVEFDNPKKKNAWIFDTYIAIRKALKESATNDNIKMTVFTGKGSYFSSGNLFGVDADTSVEDSIQLFKDFIDDIIDYPKLLVAVVNGPAIGAACTILGLFDAIYASENAWFQTPFANWGITAEGCSSYLFPRIMGPAKAGKLLYFAERMTAHEALRCNFITDIYKPSEENLLWSKLQSFTSLPLGSWIGSKKMIRADLNGKLHEINNEEVQLLRERFASDDFINAITRFMSKSKSSKL